MGARSASLFGARCDQLQVAMASAAHPCDILICPTLYVPQTCFPSVIVQVGVLVDGKACVWGGEDLSPPVPVTWKINEFLRNIARRAASMRQDARRAPSMLQSSRWKGSGTTKLLLDLTAYSLFSGCPGCSPGRSIPIQNSNSEF